MRQRTEEPFVQLTTRIPRTLHRTMRLHCVKAGVQVMEFVRLALEEQLEGEPESAH